MGTAGHVPSAAKTSSGTAKPADGGTEGLTVSALWRSAERLQANATLCTLKRANYTT